MCDDILTSTSDIIQNTLSEQEKEELEMRKLHNKNRSSIYDNMLTDRINNAKCGSTTEDYISNTNVHALLCTCTNCKKISSSKDIFQYEQYM